MATICLGPVARADVKDCNQCGKCCTKYADGGLAATPEEIDWWSTFRPEIARFARDGKIWRHPETGEQLERCPWLRKVDGAQRYTCDIYHDRPDDCRHYPVKIDQMVEDECEMLEVRDLADVAKAQRRLDQIMIDSRPPSRHD